MKPPIAAFTKPRIDPAAPLAVFRGARPASSYRAARRTAAKALRKFQCAHDLAVRRIMVQGL